jgi:hypothetical protein
LRELATYPDSQFNDQVDSTSQVFDFIKGRTLRSPGWGVPEEYRRQAEKALGRISERPVRLKAPHQSTVITITGRRIGVPATLIIEVTEEDSLALLQNGFKELRDESGPKARNGHELRETRRTLSWKGSRERMRPEKFPVPGTKFPARPPKIPCSRRAGKFDVAN